jgi:hypothetical protein
MIGKAAEILNDDAQLARLTDKLIKNLEADLVKYDIQDKSTLKSYYATLTGCYFFRNNYDKALSFVPKMQELADKNAEKLTTAVFLRAYVSAAKTVGNEKSDEFRQTFSKEFSAIWNTIPYNEVKDEVEANKGQLSLFNPNLVTAGIDTQIQPFLDNNKNVVSEDLVVSFIGIRNVLDKRVALVPSMLQVMTDLYERNASKVVKKDIWAEREAVFTDKDTGSPLVVAVWDSGVDMSIFPEYVRHKDTKGNNGIGYSLVEYKNDGLLLENPQGKITSDVNRLQALTKGFMDIQAAINSPEADEVRRTMSSLKTEEADRKSVV